MADAALRRRHLPIQRELPRPTKINFGMGRSGAGEDEEVQAVAEELRKELLAMLRYDDYQYPVDGKSRDDSKKRKRKRQKVDPKLPNLPKFDDAELTEARNLVRSACPFYICLPACPVCLPACLPAYILPSSCCFGFFEGTQDSFCFCFSHLVGVG